MMRTVRKIDDPRSDGELCAVLRRGGADGVHAGQVLICRHFGWIIRGVQRIAGRRWEDFIADGVEGAYQALRRFDPDKAMLTTYMRYWVELKVREAVKGDALIRGARDERQLRQQKTMDDHQRSRRVGRCGEAVAQMLADRSTPPSSGPRDDGLDVRLRRLFGRLDPREQEVLMLRARGLTLRQIGTVLDLSRERVRQIETKGRRGVGMMRVPVVEAGLVGRVPGPRRTGQVDALVGEVLRLARQHGRVELAPMRLRPGVDRSIWGNTLQRLRDHPGVKVIKTPGKPRPGRRGPRPAWYVCEWVG